MTDKPQTPAPDWDARARHDPLAGSQRMTLRDRVAKAAETYLHQRADFAAPINFADLADAVIEAGLSERDAGWQPIEDAPRDGTMILGWCRSLGRHIVYWGAQPEHNPHATWISATCRINHIDKPTHWRPLPAPPDPKDQQA